MKILEPTVEYWEQKDPIEHVARCARICYGKEGTDKAQALYDRLIKSNHISMLRHNSIYAIGPNYPTILDLCSHFEHCPYIGTKVVDNTIYLATNGNFMYDLEHSKSGFYKMFATWIIEHSVSPEEFNKTETGHSMMRYTFCVTTQISTSRELNRVSPNNISEQSTRYVYEDGSIVRPWWIPKSVAKAYNEGDFPTISLDIDVMKYNCFLSVCNSNFVNYRYMIDNLKLNRQDARDMLPLVTATKCAYTYSIKEWRNIIDLRYYGTTGKPHPNAKIIAGYIKDNLENLGHNFR